MGIGNNIECDTGRGEQYMRSSPRKVSTWDQCKKSCEDSNTGCESVTYFRSSGWCSHFSTPCGKFKKKKNAVSSRFQSAQGSQSAQAKKRTFIDLGSNKACNTDEGEEYMDNSPGKLRTLRNANRRAWMTQSARVSHTSAAAGAASTA